MLIFPTLQSKRLILRKLVKEDVNPVFKIRSDAEVGTYLGRSLATSMQDAYDHISTIKKLEREAKCIYWVIASKDHDTYLGSITLWNFNSTLTEADLGYEMLPEYQGLGYTQEALDAVLGFTKGHPTLQKIYGITHVQNVKSISILKKYNFILEALEEDRVTYSLFIKR